MNVIMHHYYAFVPNQRGQGHDMRTGGGEGGPFSQGPHEPFIAHVDLCKCPGRVGHLLCLEGVEHLWLQNASLG